MMWRSLLFVPVLNERLIEGAARRDADAIVLDLEAAVPQTRKNEARAFLSKAVSHLKAAGGNIAVRINPLHLGGIDDINVSMETGVELIVLPQATLTASRQAAKQTGSTRLIPLIESPSALINALPIAEASKNVAGLGLGVEDYSTKMGAPPTPDLLIPAAFQVVQAARAAGCEPLVIPDTIADYTDLTRFETATKKARALGASGSFAIHPNQIEILNRVFMPTAEEFSEAQEIVGLVQQASQKGDAIATRNGKMLDEPIVARARSTLARNERFADQS